MDEPARFQIRVQPPVPTSPTGGVARVVLTGEMDIAAMDTLSRALTRAAGLSGVEVVEVDLAAVTFLDAAALGTILAARKAAAARRKVLRVSGATGVPRRILEITGALGLLGGKDDG